MLGIGNSNWYADAIDWIGDAIEGIGYHCGFDYTTIELQVNNYRVAIPSHLESIDYINHNGRRLPLGTDESDYGFVRRHTGERPNILTYEETLEVSKYIDALDALREMDPTIPGVLDQINNYLFLIESRLGTSRLAGRVNGWRHDFYNIEDTSQYIKTSFPQGIIEVKCRTFRVDSEGLPLVVNKYNYKEAITWFIASRLLLSGKYQSTTIKYEYAWEQWDGQYGFRNRAANEGKALSRDQMERLRQRWTSIKRDVQVSQY